MATPTEEMARVSQALNTALTNARNETAETDIQSLDLATDRYIIFSDHHKGARNGADDFRGAERAYNSALAYYYRQGHTLIALGDVEELWEERPVSVLKAYEYTLKLEARFNRQGRYVRLWGNHDDIWQYPDLVSRYLGPIFGDSPLRVYESLQLKVMDGEQELGTLFLAHGHQGTLESDRFTFVSRFFVRYVWRPFQRFTHTSLNTPARDWDLRSRHNIAMYAWAENQDKLVLIAGHTHQPVFKSQSHEAQTMEQLTQLEEEIATLSDDKVREAELRERSSFLAAELEWIRAQERREPKQELRMEQRKPCYFNTGCCCFRDGNVTGLEISSGKIRLVRWPNDDDRPKPKILAETDLREVFATCGA